MPTAMIRNAGIVQCLFLIGSFCAMGSTSAFKSPPTLTASRRHYGTPVSSPKIIAALVALQAEKEPSTTEPTTNTEKKTKSPPNMFFSTAVDATPKQQQKATPPKEKEDSGGDLIPTSNNGNNNNNELLEMFLDVSGKIAKDMFVVLRKTAATALTSSLPVEEQQELLERTLGTQRVPQKQKPAKNNDDDDEEDYYNNRPTLSVKENVAAAVVQQVQRERPAQWEQEKVALLQQAEQAAQERVATELAIQRQRMEMEKQLLQQQTKNAQLQLQEKTKALQALKLQQEQQQQQQQQQLVEQQTLSSGRTEETETESVVNEQEDKLAALQQELDQKESQAKQDQEMIEQLTQQLEELKAAAAASTETQTQDEDSPTSSSSSSSSSSSIAAPTTTTKDEKPRIHAGRYTAAEYRALTEEEKEMVKALREKEGITESVQSTEDDEVESDNTLHPVLGPVIQDLGYKRIHLVSAGRLGTIPIWKKQRIYRHERAKAMVNDKWKTMHLGLPGIICLHEDPEGKLAIIDGQHRVGMMMLLRDKQRRELENAPTGLDVNNVIDFDRVLVEVYPQHDSDDAKHAQELFAEINKAEPLKLVDMPGVAKAKDRNIITDAVDQLYNLYPSMFSPSQRCRVPNINVDNLRNSLFGANVMKTHDLTTSKKLLDWMLQQNELLASKYEDNEEAQKVVSPKAWKKASDHGFYLGLESSWLYK